MCTSPSLVCAVACPAVRLPLITTSRTPPTHSHGTRSLGLGRRLVAREDERSVSVSKPLAVLVIHALELRLVRGVHPLHLRGDETGWRRDVLMDVCAVHALHMEEMRREWARDVYAPMRAMRVCFPTCTPLLSSEVKSTHVKLSHVKLSQVTIKNIPRLRRRPRACRHRWRRRVWACRGPCGRAHAAG
jgi:hypothetical protein